MCASSGLITLYCLLRQHLLLGHGAYWLDYAVWSVSFRDPHVAACPVSGNKAHVIMPSEEQTHNPMLDGKNFTN